MESLFFIYSHLHLGQPIGFPRSIGCSNRGRIALPAFDFHGIFDFRLSAFDFEGFAVSQHIRDFFMGRIDDSAEGLPGNVHFERRLLLVQLLEIGQLDRLIFVQRQNDLFQGKGWYTSLGLEVIQLPGMQSISR